MTEGEQTGPYVGPVDGGTTLSISAVSADGSAVVRLEGELDLSTAARAEQALADELVPGARTLIVDLSHLDFCDAAGLRVFVQARRRAQEAGARLRLVHPTRMVRRVLEVAELGWLVADPSRAERPGTAGFFAAANP